jgi:hypothetical protein
MDTILVEFKDGDGGLLSWTEATIADSDPELPPGCVCGSQGKDALTRTERLQEGRGPGLKVTRTGGSEGRNACVLI